jgi:hypothetical protein
MVWRTGGLARTPDLHVSNGSAIGAGEREADVLADRYFLGAALQVEAAGKTSCAEPRTERVAQQLAAL